MCHASDGHLFTQCHGISRQTSFHQSLSSLVDAPQGTSNWLIDWMFQLIGAIAQWQMQKSIILFGSKCLFLRLCFHILTTHNLNIPSESHKRLKSKNNITCEAQKCFPSFWLRKIIKKNVSLEMHQWLTAALKLSFWVGKLTWLTHNGAFTQKYSRKTKPSASGGYSSLEVFPLRLVRLLIPLPLPAMTDPAPLTTPPPGPLLSLAPQ